MGRITGAVGFRVEDGGDAISISGASGIELSNSSPSKVSLSNDSMSSVYAGASMTSLRDGGLGMGVLPFWLSRLSAVSSELSSPNTDDVIERSCCTRPPRKIPGCGASDPAAALELVVAAGRLGQ